MDRLEGCVPIVLVRADYIVLRKQIDFSILVNLYSKSLHFLQTRSVVGEAILNLVSVPSGTQGLETTTKKEEINRGRT